MKKQTLSATQNALTTLGTKDETPRFFGIYYRVLKKLVNLFTAKYHFDVQPPTSPCVYICRHKNTKGALKVMKSLTFDAHPFMLSVFQSFKSTFKQFYGYTFTKRFKLPKFIAFFPAFFCALVIAPLYKSSKAIPTHRKGAKALTTLKTANDYLLQGESVIIFPDVDYVSESDTVGDIYEGFLYLEKLYFNKTFKHLEFKVLKIEEKSKKITESEPLKFSGNLDYKDEFKLMVFKIRNNM